MILASPCKVKVCMTIIDYFGPATEHLLLTLSAIEGASELFMSFCKIQLIAYLHSTF